MLAVAGVSYKTATIDLRERLAVDAAALAELLPQLRSRFGPVVVLSTCNRTELYASGAGAEQRACAMAAFLAERSGISASAAGAPFFVLEDGEAVRHLYRVATGLESLVAGEVQILGQVRQALHTSQRHEAADALLMRLFQCAVSAGRRLRAAGPTPGSAASVSAAAVDLAGSLLGNLSDRAMLLIGTGEAGTLTARTLLARGAKRIVIAGRTMARTEKLASELEVSAISLQALPEALIDADVAISATGARDFQLSGSVVQEAMLARPDRHLLLIDLAVPRDVDPSAREISNVRLFDIDDLRPLVRVQTANDSRSADIEAALDEEVRDFLSWWEARSIIPTIAALRDHAEMIRLGELRKTLGRLPNLSPEERQRIEALTAAIVNKLLHQPIMYLKECDGAPAHVDAVRELFALPAGRD